MNAVNNDISCSSQVAAPPCVASTLPPTAPRPEPFKRVPFLKALLLFWLLPKRYGPHLAADSFLRALAAQAAAILLAASAAGLALLGRKAETLADLHQVRTRLAESILETAADTSGTPWAWLAALGFVGAVPLAELALIALGTLTMPLNATGDSAVSVWKRSVKNALWSSTAILPGVLALAGAYVAGLPSTAAMQDSDSAVMLFGGGRTESLAAVVVFWGIMAAAACCFLIAVFRGARRFVGSPDGPAFRPREPRCDDCGYLLIGLQSNSRCPECGTPVRDSLPGGRRRPTVWQQRGLGLEGFVDIVRMQWAVLRGSDVFRRITVRHGLASARRFWWMTWLLLILASLIVLRALYLLVPEEHDTPFIISFASIVAILMPPVIHFALTFAACLWAQFRYHLADYRVSAIVCYYASPLLWPLVMSALLALAVACLPVMEHLQQVTLLDLPLMTVTAAHVLGLTLILLAIGSAVFALLRLDKALKAVRYANV